MTGSRLRAADGEMAVETIVPGDRLVVLRDAIEILEPVVWVGRSRVDLSRQPSPEDAAPIRFKQDCLAPGQPVRDLLVSPEHCMIIDGLCVPAKYLVNGASIVSERDHAPFTYYHVELKTHGILVAEGAPSESYLDTDGHADFDNACGPRRLFPQFKLPVQAGRWLTDACAPLARVPEDVSPIWRRVAERAAGLGHSSAKMAMLDDADLHLQVDGRRIRPTAAGDDAYTFIVPRGAANICLTSRICIPADRMLAELRDTRRLGVRVSEIAVTAGSETVSVFPADHPGLSQGWHDAEQGAGEIWRWTNGAGVLPWTPMNTPAVMIVRCKPAEQYPDYDAQPRLVA